MPARSFTAGPVLDYASPRAHGKVRLPAQSKLRVRTEREAVVVEEWLQAKSGAIAAMVFAVVILCILPAGFIFDNRHLGGQALMIQVSLIGVMWLAELIVLLMVVNNTWRRTVLEVRREGILLTLSAPSGTRRYEWGGSDVEAILFESTTKATDRNHLGEVQIHVAAQPVIRLFTDHPAVELEPIAAALQRAVASK